MQSDGILPRLKTYLFLVDRTIKKLNTQLFILDHYNAGLIRVLPRTQLLSLIIFSMIYQPYTICTWVKPTEVIPSHLQTQKLLETTAAAKFM